MAKVNFNKDALKKHHFWIIAAVVPLLTLIAFATTNELAMYIQFLNKRGSSETVSRTQTHIAGLGILGQKASFTVSDSKTGRPRGLH